MNEVCQFLVLGAIGLLLVFRFLWFLEECDRDYKKRMLEEAKKGNLKARDDDLTWYQ